MPGDVSKIWKALVAVPPPAAVAGVPGLHIWRADLAALAPEEAHLASVVDETERAEIWRLRQPRDRQRLLLRRVLGRYLDLPPALLRFERGLQGQPRLSGLAFSSSCSGDWLLLAMTHGAEIGGDVEEVHECGSTATLIASCCSRSEQDRIAALPAAAREVEFLRLWTAKEAVLKLRGTGFDEGVDLPGLLENLRAGERVVELPAGPQLIASLAVAPLRTA